jgi:hypothetical protein
MDIIRVAEFGRGGDESGDRFVTEHPKTFRYGNGGFPLRGQPQGKSRILERFLQFQEQRKTAKNLGFAAGCDRNQLEGWPAPQGGRNQNIGISDQSHEPCAPFART